MLKFNMCLIIKTFETFNFIFNVIDRYKSFFRSNEPIRHTSEVRILLERKFNYKFNTLVYSSKERYLDAP